MVSEHLNHHAHHTALDFHVFDFVFLTEDRDELGDVLTRLQLVEHAAPQFLKVSGSLQVVLHVIVRSSFPGE